MWNTEGNGRLAKNVWCESVRVPEGSPTQPSTINLRVSSRKLRRCERREEGTQGTQSYSCKRTWRTYEMILRITFRTSTGVLFYIYGLLLCPSGTSTGTSQVLVVPVDSEYKYWTLEYWYSSVQCPRAMDHTNQELVIFWYLWHRELIIYSAPVQTCRLWYCRLPAKLRFPLATSSNPMQTGAISKGLLYIWQGVLPVSPYSSTPVSVVVLVPHFELPTAST